ncbi:MAG TPA: hypothetical protein VIM64_01145 [Puia sp.]
MEPPSWSVRLNRIRQLFWLFALLTIGYMIWARGYLSPLTSGEIVRFEVAKTVDRAQHIMQEWRNTGKYEQGVRSTTVAFFFIILYTLSIGLGCRFISACTGNEILAKGGRGFAWLIVVASVSDIIENIALSRTLSGHMSQVNLLLAYNLARIKFSIVIVCLLFILVCTLYWGIGKIAREDKSFPR